VSKPTVDEVLDAIRDYGATRAGRRRDVILEEIEEMIRAITDPGPATSRAPDSVGYWLRKVNGAFRPVPVGTRYHDGGSHNFVFFDESATGPSEETVLNSRWRPVRDDGCWYGPCHPVEVFREYAKVRRARNDPAQLAKR
jgi:hypothetical protein